MCEVAGGMGAWEAGTQSGLLAAVERKALRGLPVLLPW